MAGEPFGILPITTGFDRGDEIDEAAAPARSRRLPDQRPAVSAPRQRTTVAPLERLGAAPRAGTAGRRR